MDVGAWAKEHPVLIVGGVIVVGLGLYMLLRGGGGAAVQSGGVDPNAALSYQAQLDSLAAQSAQQSSQQGFQLALTGAQFTGQLALLKEQDATALAGQNTAAQVAVLANQNDFNVQMSGIAASLAGLENTNLTNEHLQAITSNEAITINATNADVNKTGILSNRDVAINQANNFASVQKEISKNNLTGSIVGGVFGLLGHIL